MEITKIKTPIACDVLGCKNLAEYKIGKEKENASFYVCKQCLTEMEEEIKKVKKKS